MIAKAPDLETTILTRVIAPEHATLSIEAAQAFLALHFSDEDKRQMAALAEKARLGELSAEEAAWTRAYERIGSLVGLLQSKARTTIKQQAGATK